MILFIYMLILIMLCHTVLVYGNLTILYLLILSFVILFPSVFLIFLHASHGLHPSKFGGIFSESLKQDIICFAKNKRIFACRERVPLTNHLIVLKQRLVIGNDFLSSEIASLESWLKNL